MDQRLADRVAVITGAGDGIGEGIARRFAQEGAKVVVAEIDEARGIKVAEALEADFGGEALFLHTDATKQDDNEAMVATAVDRWGRIDILVNNAWGGDQVGLARVDKMPDSGMEFAWHMNVMGPFWAMKAAFPHMRGAGWGRIVNICSLNGVNAHMGSVHYNSTKEALRTLTRTAAREWAGYGITANVICPGADRGQGESVAQWRGLPVQWTDAAAAADGGAGRASLVGTPSGAGYDWTFTHAGQAVQGRGSVADGINLAADTLAARYAPPSTRGIATVSVSVAGIDDLGAYAGLLSFLTDLSIVRDASVGELDGDMVRIDLTMRGDKQLLERLGALDGHLVPGSDDAAGTGRRADLIYLP